MKKPKLSEILSIVDKHLGNRTKIHQELKKLYSKWYNTDEAQENIRLTIEHWEKEYPQFY